MGCHCLLHSNLVKMEYITDYRGRLKNLPITSLNMLNIQEIGHMRLSGHFSVPRVCLRIQRHSCRINLKHILPENTDLKKNSLRHAASRYRFRGDFCLGCQWFLEGVYMKCIIQEAAGKPVPMTLLGVL